MILCSIETPPAMPEWQVAAVTSYLIHRLNMLCEEGKLPMCPCVCAL